MGLKITFDNPSHPKGMEFGINDVGIVKNGGSVTISDDQLKDILERMNADRGEDEKKLTERDLFKGDMFKTEKVADPKPPNEEATEPIIGELGVSEGVNL